jgi:uncharacterized membrane protein (DUF2068 family)
MTRNTLIVLEILVAVVALAGGARTVLRSRKVLAEGTDLSPAKLSVILDMVLCDVITVLMLVAAWLLWKNGSWARLMSVVAGAALIVCAAARPSLSDPHSAVAPALVVLGIAVVVLSLVLPSAG